MSEHRSSTAGQAESGERVLASAQVPSPIRGPSEIREAPSKRDVFVWLFWNIVTVISCPLIAVLIVTDGRWPRAATMIFGAMLAVWWICAVFCLLIAFFRAHSVPPGAGNMTPVSLSRKQLTWPAQILRR